MRPLLPSGIAGEEYEDYNEDDEDGSDYSDDVDEEGDLSSHPGGLPVQWRRHAGQTRKHDADDSWGRDREHVKCILEDRLNNRGHCV